MMGEGRLTDTKKISRFHRRMLAAVLVILRSTYVLVWPLDWVMLEVMEEPDGGVPFSQPYVDIKEGQFTA